jgi:hypothetical protein
MPIFGGVAIMDVEYTNGQFMQGSWFGLFLRNFSNRDFTIVSYQIQNGGVTVASAAGDDISGGDIATGELIGVIFTLPADMTDNDVTSVMTISDSATGLSFPVMASYPYVSP